MNITKTCLCSLILFGATQLSFSQTPEEEIDYDDIEVKKDKDQIEVDRQELARFKTKVEAFELAFENQNEYDVNRLKDNLILDMKRELAQSDAKIEKDKDAYDLSKDEYKLSKKRTKISKEDYKMSKDDEADEDAYDRDKDIEKVDKKRMKDMKDIYKDQKKLHRDQEKIIDKLSDYTFNFIPDAEKDNRKHKELIFEFIELMEEDIEATEDSLD